jgi:outer membrane receptor protein involved in Fe transport
MLKRKPLSVAIATALGVVSASGAFMDVAYAADDEMLEEVVVTGSRIKRANIDSASPVTVFDQDEIKARGFTDVGYMLQRMPSMAGSPIGTTTNNGGNGAVVVNLRGLGSNRTLTLVNGKRVVDGGDYQTIPATMIERVEILKDGASAVYGADAVAGVVNIITKKNYEGFEIEAQTADFFDMDSGNQNTWNFIAGKTFDGGSFMFGAEYVDQEHAYQSDAPWDYFQDSWFIYPAGCEAQLTAPYDGTTSGGCYIVGSSRIPESRLQFVDQGRFMNEGSGLVAHDGRTYNYAPVNFIQTPYERTNIFAEINYDLSDEIHLLAEIRYNKRESEQELAPQPYNSPTDPSYDGVWNGTAYSGISEDNYYLVQAVDAYNLTSAGIASPLIYEPVRDARRRMVETTRSFDQSIDQLQVNFTLSGELNDIAWEAYFIRGWRDRTDGDFGQFSGPLLFNAMGPSADLDGDGTPECYGDVSDASTVIAGCVPFDFFSGPYSVTQDMLDYVGIDLVDNVESEMTQAGFSVSGEALELPVLDWIGLSGSVGWALGYEYREEEYTYAPDSAKQQDAVTGNTGAGTVGGYSVDSWYAEALVPVFDNGTQSLDITAGYRYDDFDTIGDDSTYQLGVEFQVLEQLKLRATTGEVFRAPGIGESFAGQVDSFPTYLDPCDPSNNVTAPGCAGASVQLDTQVLARVGGNPFLEPETGDTLTVGAVWTPDFSFADVSVTIDYWETEIEDVISTVGVQFILDECYINQVASSCQLITRRSDYSVAQILDAPLNVAEFRAEGVDSEIRVDFETDWGQIDASFLWAHMLDQERTAFAGSPSEDLSGRYNGEAYAEDKINYSFSLSQDNWRVSYLGEWISDLKADVSFLPYIQDVDDQLYHDITASYQIESLGLTIAGGVRNVTDEEPPYIDFGFNASTDPSTYRLFGRGYYLRLNWKFNQD